MTEDGARPESGAILPLFVLVLVVLFGFAAFGVDLTAAYAETRQAQSTADAAVLAASLEFLDSSSPTNTDLYDEVKAYTDTNWGAKAPTDADWAACQDPDKPGEYAPIQDTSATPATVITDCISIKQVQGEPALIRVRLPNYEMPTAFARIIGFDTVAISATATAELRYRENSAILPFSVARDAGTEECLATPPSGLLPGDAAPCGGPTQGNFGLLDSPWFGAPDAPHFTDGQGCPSSPNFRTVTPHNIAIGLDHLIRVSPAAEDGSLTPGQSAGPPAPAGADTCTSAANGDIPWVLLTQTGNSITSNASGAGCTGSIFECGMLGSDPSPTAANAPGRLRQAAPPTTDLPGGYVASSAPRTLTVGPGGGFSVDNLGLWEYLLDTGGNDACDKSEYRESISGLEGRELTEQLIDCLYTGSGPSGIIFDDSLLESPRFAVVPQLNYNSGSQFGTKYWDVVDLKPVYLHASWYTCSNGNPDDCLFLPYDFEDEDEDGFAVDDRDSYSILFQPGEGEQRPCELNAGGGCGAPAANRWEMQGLSALILDWDWFPEDAENQFGGNAPFEVFLHPNE